MIQLALQLLLAYSSLIGPVEVVSDGKLSSYHINIRNLCITLIVMFICMKDVDKLYLITFRLPEL